MPETAVQSTTPAKGALDGKQNRRQDEEHCCPRAPGRVTPGQRQYGLRESTASKCGVQKVIISARAQESLESRCLLSAPVDTWRLTRRRQDSESGALAIQGRPGVPVPRWTKRSRQLLSGNQREPDGNTDPAGSYPHSPECQQQPSEQMPYHGRRRNVQPYLHLFKLVNAQ